MSMDPSVSVTLCFMPEAVSLQELVEQLLRDALLTDSLPWEV